MIGKQRAAIAAMVLLFGCATGAWANETDQFTMPVGKEFVDLGHYYSECHYRVLAAAVQDTNKRIRTALKNRDKYERNELLKRLYSPGALADTVRGKFLPGFFDMIEAEDALKSKKAEANFPGKVLLHRPSNWIYSYANLPFDPRRLVLLFPSGTVKVYGTYMGTDKLGHFHDLGHLYFKDYLFRRIAGESEEKAIEGVVFSWSRGPISEGALIGNMATGVYSNGDLAANYIGFKFYRNLTEPVRVKGRMVPPMIVRDGEFWKLNDHVGAMSDFLEPFISDHLNEALNPCVYELGSRWAIEDRLHTIAADVRAFYIDEHGRQRPREWFDNKVDELWEYYGEDYGHSRKKDNLLTIGNTCFTQEVSAPIAHQE